MFSSIYNQSLQFLTYTASGLGTLLTLLFTPFNQLLYNGGIDISKIADLLPNWLLGQWLTNLLSYSVISLTVGGGLVIFMTITIIKYIIGIIT